MASPTMEYTVAPTTPPKAPATTRAASSRRKVGASAHSSVASAKPCIQSQQDVPAVEPVNMQCTQQPGDRGADAVGGHQQGELRWRDGQQAHQLRTQRHQDHEVQDVGDLDRREREQQRPLAVARICRARGSGAQENEPRRTQWTRRRTTLRGDRPGVAPVPPAGGDASRCTVRAASACRASSLRVLSVLCGSMIRRTSGTARSGR